MIRHALKVIEGLLAVTDLNYFMVLSDQIHFCGTYAAIMLAKLIETVKTAQRTLDISESLFAKSVDQISALGLQLRSIGRTSSDLATKYANAIDEALILCKVVPSVMS